MQLHTLSTQQVSVKLMSSQWKVPVSSLNWFENHTFFISQFYPLFLTRFFPLCCEIIEVPHAWTLRKLKDIRRNVSLDGVSGSLSIYPLCLLHYSFAKKKKKRKHQYPTVEELMSGCRALTHTHTHTCCVLITLSQTLKETQRGRCKPKALQWFSLKSPPPVCECVFTMLKATCKGFLRRHPKALAGGEKGCDRFSMPCHKDKLIHKNDKNKSKNRSGVATASFHCVLLGRKTSKITLPRIPTHQAPFPSFMPN